jgi:hypothetical protein
LKPALRRSDVGQRLSVKHLFSHRADKRSEVFLAGIVLAAALTWWAD